ncbi:MAG: hypothetical protein K6T86_16420, partial [Pirellulales bacterium]|nr:hypothetical protein [Pirellulales bacterium]
VTNDFSVRYVAENSNRLLPLIYRYTAANCSGVRKSVAAVTLNSRCRLSTRPAGCPVLAIVSLSTGGAIGRWTFICRSIVCRSRSFSIGLAPCLRANPPHEQHQGTTPSP